MVVDKSKAKKADIESEGPKPPTIQEFFENEDDMCKGLNMDEMGKLAKELVQEIKNEIDKLASESEGETIAAFKKKVAFNIMQIRHINRRAQYRNKIEREAVSQERVKADDKFLQLQNVIHEVQHLKKEVKRCLHFKSAHEKIELVSLDEFFDKAPKEVTQAVLNQEDKHQLRLAQLAWELEQRKQLEKNMGDLSKECSDLLSKVTSQKRQLNAVKPKVDAVLEASRPLQALIDLPLEDEDELRNLSAHLHAPLFYLFLQTQTYQEIAGKDTITVWIDGKLESAMKWREPDIEFVKEAEPVPIRTSAKRRKSAVEKGVHLLHTHPLKLMLQALTEDGDVIKLTFNSLVLLKCVSVQCEVLKNGVPAGNLLCGSTVLTDLFPDDNGLICPNSTAALKLNHFGVNIAQHVDKIGHVYKWVQTACGVQSWGEQQPAEPVKGCTLVQDIVDRVVDRINARISLHKQISRIEDLQVEVPSEFRDRFPTKMLCRLTHWKSMTHDEFMSHPGVQKSRDLIHGISMDAPFFQCTIDRAPVKLIALIHIPVAYPTEPPLFVLVLKYKTLRYSNENIALRTLEELLNVGVVTSMPEGHSELLSVQMQTLLSRLDILLESDTPALAKEHLFQRPSRGPARDMPTVYHKNTNAFSF